VPTAVQATSSTLPIGATIAIGVGAIVIGALIGLWVGRRTGRRSLAQRLVALGSRLGAGPAADETSIDGALSYLEQVTGAATEAVTESSAEAIRLRRSLDTLPLGLVLCDESGNVLYRNEMASTMMASRQGDALAAQAVTELLAQAWDKGNAERTLDLYGPPRRTLGVHASQIDDGRRALGVIAVIEDVTERRRLDEIRRDFIANVSHELKTPMGALGLLAETLTAEKDRDVARRLADRIHQEAFRVSRIIDDLLDLSRLESELTRPNELVDVNLAILDSVERIKSSAEHASVSITVIEPDRPVAIRGDHRQIVSALHALLENAVAYAPEASGITLTGKVIEGDEMPDQDGSWVSVTGQAGWRSASDEVRRAKRCIQLSVTDVGTGIPANDLERIFERFYRVDRGRSRETGGTGLGLAIVRHVAVNHGGLVEVQSREGEGSTFSLILPIPEDI
jgi:two-component system sensor histidine kinase SenX3